MGDIPVRHVIFERRRAMNRHPELHSVSIPMSTGLIQGDLNVPENSRAVVLFAHGSGSSRHSPRNKYVAEVLNDGGCSTLLLDLLTPDEEDADRHTGHLRFDIDLLAERLVMATDWLRDQAHGRSQPIGYFGASTGAAAALIAAASRPDVVEAVVSRGGRPDLAGRSLSLVRAPTLLIVGERDEVVIQLNERAAAEMRAIHRMEIVPRATHLFEERGALEQVAALAREWFDQHLLRNTTTGAA
jgi:putative phosphoribosyl transferase